jgi:hypothetical protein
MDEERTLRNWKKESMMQVEAKYSKSDERTKR